jgi:hydrogenase expression/formation protein HypC
MCLAVPGELLSIDGDDPLFRSGRVSFAGVVRQANLAYVPEAKVGDYVLVHAGFALTVIDPAEAARMLETIAEIELESP